MIDIKQHARELVNKFYNTSSHSNSVKVRMLIAKESALICVQEMIKVVDDAMLFKQSKRDYYQELKKSITEL